MESWGRSPTSYSLEAGAPAPESPQHPRLCLLPSPGCLGTGQPPHFTHEETKATLVNLSFQVSLQMLSMAHNYLQTGDTGHAPENVLNP